LAKVDLKHDTLNNSVKDDLEKKDIELLKKEGKDYVELNFTSLTCNTALSHILQQSLEKGCNVPSL